MHLADLSKYISTIRETEAFAIAVISVAIFTDTFLYGMVVPVIPFSITERVGIGSDGVQLWTSLLLTIHGAGLLVASPLCGYLADHLSRRLPYLIGLATLALTTLLLCLGRNITLIALGRGCQGISAGIVWTVGLALLVDKVGQDGIGRAMGYVGIGINAGSLSGPLLGGVVFEKAGYYAVFGMCFGLVGVDFVMRLCLPDANPAPSEDDETQPANEVTPLIGEDVASSHTPTLILLLQSRRLIIALWGSFVQSSLTSAFDSLLPLFVQARFNWTSTPAGLIFLPLALPSLLGPLIGSLIDRFGPRLFTTAGFLLASPCLIALQTITDDSLYDKNLLCILLLLIGMAMQIVLPPLIAEISYVVEGMEQDAPGVFGSKGAYAQAFGLSSMAFAGGLVFGPVAVGVLSDRAGWDGVVWALGIVSGITGVWMGLWFGGPGRK